MALVTADSFGIASDGSTDVRLALTSAFDSCSPGDTFQLHANGLYLTTYNTPWFLTSPGITLEGNGASLFRNQRRTAIKASPTEDVLQVWGNNITVQNLKIFGFRKDEYTGEKLTAIVGTPAIVGTTVEMTTANDEVRLPLVGLDQVGNPKVSTNFETPFYFRQVDGLNKFEASLSASGGAGDIQFRLYNDDTNALLQSTTFTPTGTPTIYTITFDPGTTHLGTRLRVTIKKVASGGTVVVHSITPYGETGFRRADTTWFTGGNEFSDGIQTQVVTGTIIQDCEIEGTDGDGVNCATVDNDTIIRRCVVRGNGRQAYTFHRSVNYLLEDCLGREVGRSGIDFEPNNVAHTMTAGIIRRCDFLNVRNYTFAMRHWAKIIDITFEDCTSTNAGMGPISGGGRPMVMTNFVHTNTYRTEADRVANGSHVGADAIFQGIDVNVDGITTDVGIAITDLTNRSTYPTGTATEYHPSDIHIVNAVVTDPETDPFVFIEVANSTVQVIPGEPVGTTSPTWDDIRYDWDDTQVTWDGLLLGAGPAFDYEAFQHDAFQVREVVEVFVTQTMPSFTQHIAAFSGRSVAIDQTAPAFEQAAEIHVLVVPDVTQTMPSFEQAAEVALQVRGVIGSRTQVFQEDAFQDDAFQTQPDSPEEMPAFRQHLSGGVVPHGGFIAIIHQRIPQFTQSVDGTVQSGITIAQVMPVFSQAAEGELSPGGPIAQTMPMFTQALTTAGETEIVITQVMPMFTQHIRIRLSLSEEWVVSSTGEWPVGTNEEWLVRQ